MFDRQRPTCTLFSFFPSSFVFILLVLHRFPAQEIVSSQYERKIKQIAERRIAQLCRCVYFACCDIYERRLRILFQFVSGMNSVNDRIAIGIVKKSEKLFFFGRHCKKRRLRSDFERPKQKCRQHAKNKNLLRPIESRRVFYSLSKKNIKMQSKPETSWQPHNDKLIEKKRRIKMKFKKVLLGW